MRLWHSKRVLCLAASLFVFGSSLRPATGQLMGPEFHVNSYTTGQQFFPGIITDGSGNFVVVWAGNGPSDLDFGIFGRRFQATDVPIGAEFHVNSYTTGSQTTPTIAADDSGNFVVVWESALQDGSAYGVFGRRFSSAGAPVSNEFRINTYTTDWQRRPEVAANGTGEFVVVWDSRYQDGSREGIFGQLFNSAGGPVGSEFQVNTYTTSWQQEPAVAMDGAGNFVVVWESYEQDGSFWGVFGQRFNSAGNPVGSEFQVNVYTTNSQEGVSVAADDSGDFVVVWNSSGLDGSGYGVIGQRFDVAGSPAGAQFQINTYTTGLQCCPAVATDGSGNFVVVWTSQDQDGSSHGAFGQRFESAGGLVGSEFQLNTYTTNAQRRPTVLPQGSDKFVVAWEGYRQSDSLLGVTARHRGPSIFSDGLETGDHCLWSAAVGATLCP